MRSFHNFRHYPEISRMIWGKPRKPQDSRYPGRDLNTIWTELESVTPRVSLLGISIQEGKELRPTADINNMLCLHQRMLQHIVAKYYTLHCALFLDDAVRIYFIRKILRPIMQGSILWRQLQRNEFPNFTIHRLSQYYRPYFTESFLYIKIKRMFIWISNLRAFLKKL